MQPVSRRSDSFREKLGELFAQGRKVRTRRRVRRGGYEQRDVICGVERMEDRALLSGNSLLANGVIESHADAVFAPDTLPEYANAINDFVGAAGATGADAFSLSSRWSTTATNGSATVLKEVNDRFEKRFLNSILRFCFCVTRQRCWIF
jgi:hypothetical protein